jgi:hypothetical protein
MQAIRNEDGSWKLEGTCEQAEEELSPPAYCDALIRYLADMDPAFHRARESCEFEFILTLLRVRGAQDTGWDPYETTQRAIPQMKDLHARAESFEAARDLTGVFDTSRSEREFHWRRAGYGMEETQTGADRDVVAAD